MTHTLYHGTKAAYLDDIKARGLIPCAMPGNDSIWHAANRWQSPARKRSVFVTPAKDVAAMFAAYLDVHDPAIVTIALPDAELAKLRIDEAGGDKGTSHDFLRYEGSINPAWITDARKLSKVELIELALQGLRMAA